MTTFIFRLNGSDRLSEIDIVGQIEKCFLKAVEEVIWANHLMHCLENDYNATSDGFQKFISQLQNYSREYTMKYNRMIRKKVDEELSKNEV